jgi:hypothetical protein
MQWKQLVGISYYANLEKFSDVAPHSRIVHIPQVSSGDGVVLYEHINYKGHHWKLKPGKYADFTRKS